MAWSIPLYSKTQVNAAGATYASDSASATDRELALAVINNWRSSHSFPLNTLQVSLRKKAASIDQEAVVAQRIKRLPSIRHKLQRFKGMNLGRMQDLGGCRAIVGSVDQVQAVHELFSHSRHKHKLVRENDYIAEPQSSGYRGVHLIYSYNSDEKTTYNGLRIEVQVRSRLQHAWATAVETVGTFTQQALKSSQGEGDWLRFFQLMGTQIALLECRPGVPETPHDAATLTTEISEIAKSLDVVHRLSAYGMALRHVEEHSDSRSKYYVLDLDAPGGQLTIRSYARRELAQATEEYAAIERAIEGSVGRDAVMVSVDRLTPLRRAYPNYFLDTTVFLETLNSAIGS